ncbi:MAG: glycoside hydrolase family 55 protein [Phycisphaeraceae bacterium]
MIKYMLVQGGLTMAMMLALVAAGLTAPAWAVAEEPAYPAAPGPYTPPAEGGFVNVQTDGGAVGDGVTDDTAALKAILGAGKNNRHPQFGSARHIYIPDGVYLVSEPIDIGDKKKHILGQSRDGVIIRLVEDAEAFQNPDEPAAVFNFARSYEGWHFANNFFQRLHNLTVEVGPGNPGAVGVEYHTNNGGDVYNVLIRSLDPERRGAAGFSMVHGSGPGLIHHLTVDGFDRGVHVTHALHSMAFSQITVMNQRAFGFYNQNHTVSIEGLVSHNTVPALRNGGGDAHLAIVNGRFHGGAGEAAAIINENNATLFARNIDTQGYGLSLRNGERQISDAHIDEVAYPDVLTLFDNDRRSLNLPIEQPPIPGLPATAEGWTLVKADGDDLTGPLQQAIDDGAKYIFVQRGDGLLFIRDTIHIRNRVRVIHGAGTLFRSRGFEDDHGFDGNTNTVTPFEGEQKPVFRIEDGEADVVMIKLFRDEYGDAGWTYEHASDRTLVLWGARGNYRNTVEGGKAFMLDTGLEAGSVVTGDQSVWAWHVNPETYTHQPQILNDGGRLWVLGIKTEKDRTIIGTRHGGRTEAIGGLLYKNRERVGPMPAFMVDEASDVSLSYKVTGVRYQVHVHETRHGETRELPTGSTFGRRVPLFVGTQE